MRIYTEPKSGLSQGDLFAPGIDPNDRVMLISHDCEIDKPSARSCHVCTVFPLTRIDSGNRDVVRGQQCIRYFFLSEQDTIPEMYCDLRTIRPAALADVRQLLTTRLASLKAEPRVALQRQIAMFFGIDR